MLRRAASHTAHVLMEAVLGLVAVVALAACVLIWRLAQGPIDVTALVQRAHPFFSAKGAHMTIGAASLAWEGFASSDRPLDIRVRDATIRSDDGTLSVRLPQARVSLAVGQLLLGRIVPRSVLIDGAEAQLQRGPQAATPQPVPAHPAVAPTPEELLERLGRPTRFGALPPWLSQLHHVRIDHARIAVRDAALGLVWQAPHVMLDMTRRPDGGVSGTARADIAIGDIVCTLDLQATLGTAGTSVTASTTPVSPASLARLSAALAPLAGIAVPVGLRLQGSLDSALRPLTVQLSLSAGAGTIQAGTGSVAIRSATALLTLRSAELQLSALRVEFAQPAGTQAPPPVLTGSASGTAAAGRVHAVFGVQINAVSMADLGRYWPAATGGGSRDWLVQNVTAGRAHDAHVEGSLEIPMDLSAPVLTSLTGGLAADDVTLFWLRPVPPIVHGRARVTVQGPDSLLVAMDSGAQDHLMLSPGSSIRITGLQAAHQFGDIKADLSGPLADALSLLNNKRLNLLARGNMELADPAGDVTAELKLHVPLEDRVTIDQIPISGTATLAGVHLGRVAGGYDLDHGELALKVDGNGLEIAGSGDVAGIPAQLGLAMDFRNGPPDQVIQHVTATGRATQAQLAAAGLPDAAVHVISGGDIGLRVAYDGRRDDTATLQFDADLGRAAMATPFGWSKPEGPAATAGARMLLDHGHIAGVDHLHAEGPELAIVSQAQISAGHARSLLLERLDIGRTRAHGRIGFPSPDPGKDSYNIELSGKLLDLSGYLAKPAAPAKPPPVEQDDTPGPAWSADLRFDALELAKAETLAPFVLTAASNGAHILRAKLDAGARGQLAASIVPTSSGRHVAIDAADAGLVLRAIGVADNLRGGRLDLDGDFKDSLPGAPLAGTATLTEFDLLAAPAIGRLLQAMTLYGLADVLRGPGLRFSKMVAPFNWQNRVLSLANARAFSPSLGITAQGDIDLRRRIADVKGTVVPAYFFNQLLGDLPLVGRVFSPEKGGGVFAARYSVRGPLSDPKVGVNPLSALTPGFLREGFGLLGKTQRERQ